MKFQLRTTPEAEAQIREIDNWWRTNRPAAPDLFLNELSQSLELLANSPHIGRLYRLSPVRDTRRLLLRASRYHIYYLIETGEVMILAVWHAQRGVGPSLRML